MKALLITGTLAQPIVEQYAKESNITTEILALKTQIAAFLTPQTIKNALQTHNLKDINIILTPGLMPEDTQTITDTFKIPTFKGPRYAADLPAILDSLNEVTLSTTVPADDILREKLQQKALQELERVEQNREELLKREGSLLIGGLAVSKALPMRVLAEIVDAPLLTDEEIARQAKEYVQNGANMVDIGMVAGKNSPEEAKRAVLAAKSAVDVPVSIDTLKPEETKAAIDAGVDLILSIDEGNMEELASYAKHVPVVIIPSNQRKGIFPRTVKARVQMLNRLIKKAQELGYEKIIGDLILEPTNIVESFSAFRAFAEKNPTTPLLIGVSNVTELFDADSVGINALLARLSSEVGVDILLVTEKSPKTRGTVSEICQAARMMFLAKKRGSVPRDLGLDLLILKDKNSREIPYDTALEGSSKVLVVKEQDLPFTVDPKGIFKIALDRQENLIVALHFKSFEAEKPSSIIKGKTAESVLGKILALELVSQFGHVAYLGRELGLAEVALITGKEYLQDGGLFRACGS
ncbi:MAG: dihydropteroate synthase-like protein [Candidatus Bathyarchaeota archaeon]|nr:dihydropteroate synthase-like protein [Candidatus Bathyarchaeota archaeon]